MAVIASSDSDFSTLLSNNKNVVVKYFADWCGSCKLFAPKFRRMSEDEANEGVLFLEVNAETSPEARKLAGVNNLPFIATFSNGVLVEGFPTSKEEKVTAMIATINTK